MPRVTGPDGQATQVIKSRREKARIREGWIHLGVNVVILLLVMVVLLSFVFCVFRVSGNDMYPALQDGDLVVAWRLDRSFKQDDVVVFKADGKTRVGRVVAREGDVVDMPGSGSVTVNGTPENDILYETDAGDSISYPYVVPEGEVFILGDFRTQATDSREFGAVPVSDVEGTAIGMFRRREF